MNSPPTQQVPPDIAEAYRGIAVAVVGATGFIGRWVARWLGGSGARLHLLVRDPQRAAAELARFGVQGEMVAWSADRLGDLQGILAAINPAVVFNLAGYGVRRDERDETLARLVNRDVVETLAAAQASIPSNWPGLRLVHVGSALEYGVADGDLDELSTTPDPTTVYGISKLEGTNVLSDFCEKTEFPAVTARLFTVYGPGELDGRLLPSLISAATTTNAIPLTAGLQRRDFTYVEDVAEGLLRLGSCESLPSTVINLATGKLSTVREFIQAAAEIVGIAADRLAFGTLPTRPEEMNHDDVQIERLRIATRWQPTISVKQGITRTVRFVHMANAN